MWREREELAECWFDKNVISLSKSKYNNALCNGKRWNHFLVPGLTWKLHFIPSDNINEFVAVLRPHNSNMKCTFVALFVVLCAMLDFDCISLVLCTVRMRYRMKRDWKRGRARDWEKEGERKCDETWKKQGKELRCEEKQTAKVKSSVSEINLHDEKWMYAAIHLCCFIQIYAYCLK